MTDFEKLGTFYLGRPWDGATGTTKPSPFLYDSKDLTTHGLIVGMTGSGKTGLSVVLLEEAALDGIPAIVIDPKGDMANLALRFPELGPGEFLPWIDRADALRNGVAPEDLSRDTAARWESGLAEWGQTKARIRALTEAAEVAIYTPGSASGRPIAALASFEAPPPAVVEDEDALRDHVTNAASGLLGLVGIESDPMTSREHILLTNLLERWWRAREDAGLERLLTGIQKPPFERLGALDLESFYPAKERFELTAKLNGLLASPAFGAWRQGEPLDVARLLHTAAGKPRLAVLSIAHLSDAERMFFVTLLLDEVIAWMRGQEGTGSLRALLYMDEIFGYFPPVKAPPSKAPMLTLLKQARAFGLGVVLATQNPVDLDYKGLSNIGTWFLGRLQTARDRERVLGGLESAAGGLDPERAERLLSTLEQRVFLMQNVHEDAPGVFQTRWAMSYLRGPLTLEQVKRLTVDRSEAPETRPTAPPPTTRVSSEKPLVPPDVPEVFLPGDDPVYRPTLLASAQLHYVRSSVDVDHWETLHWLTSLDGASSTPDWSRGEAISAPAPRSEPAAGVGFAPAPVHAVKEFERWKMSFAAFLYRERRLTIYRCKALRLASTPGEREADFRVRLKHRLREKRDEELERLRRTYAAKLTRMEERVRSAEARVDRESSQYQSKRLETAIDFGMTLAGALFGRKLGSVSNVGRASRTARTASRASREREDVARAEESLAAEKENLARLEAELAEETDRLVEATAPENVAIEATSLPPRKPDIRVDRFALAWARDGR